MYSETPERIDEHVGSKLCNDRHTMHTSLGQSMTEVPVRDSRRDKLLGRTRLGDDDRRYTRPLQGPRRQSQNAD
jgi:hypothetical protein